MNRLRLWRQGEGLSQEEAGLRLSMSRNIYNAIESGRLRPSPAIAQKLASSFGETADALLRPIAPRIAVPVLRAHSEKARA